MRSKKYVMHWRERDACYDVNDMNAKNNYQ